MTRRHDLTYLHTYIPPTYLPDTDYNTDNWEPGWMTIFVTWQLIVAHWTAFAILAMFFKWAGNQRCPRVDILKVCFRSVLKIILDHNYFKKYFIWGLNDRWKNWLKRYSLSGIVAILINWWGIHLPPLRRRGEVTSESKVNSPFLKVGTSETRRTKELNIG